MLLSFEFTGELCLISHTCNIIHCNRDPIGDSEAVKGSHEVGLLAVLTERKRSDLAVYMYQHRTAHRIFYASRGLELELLSAFRCSIHRRMLRSRKLS